VNSETQANANSLFIPFPLSSGVRGSLRTTCVATWTVLRARCAMPATEND
jgi:hypothetical protein